MRRFIALFCFTLLAWAANQKLYLKDGSFHVVREYKVEGDRVRFYSVERSDWEEMPVELVDLKRTQSEAAERKAAIEEEAKIISAEDKVIRDLENEVMKIPQNPGVYMLIDGQLKIFKQAESKVHGNKGRSILKAMSPVPVVSGKATLELDQPRSLNVITTPNPEFYIQLAADEAYALVRLTPKGGVRIVEKLTIVPITKEIIEEREVVPVFKKEMTANGLVKFWPEKPLPPGEYAVIEFTEGKLNTQIWDFGYKPQ